MNHLFVHLQDVKDYEQANGVGPAAHGQDTTEPGHDQQVDAVPHFANASDLVFFHRGRGVHELHELARLVDEEFTGTAKLTDEVLGRLLPANPGREVSDEAHKRQGHRLRKKTK